MPNALNSVNTVYQAIYDLLVTKIADLGVKAIYLGDRARDVKSPSIWIVPENSSINNDGSMSKTEDWELHVLIISMVESKDPIAGRALCNNLAIKASSYFLQDRQISNTCSDCERINWYPAYARAEQDDNVFGAGVELKITLETMEE